ncbi:hypothetical protein Avbf_04801 [Armadillidium vulgare]|nr:hypothetical protein Avbf_04801 [Armadillidium vulgare]
MTIIVPKKCILCNVNCSGIPLDDPYKSRILDLLGVPKFSDYVLPYLNGTVSGIAEIKGMRNQIINENYFIS